MQPKSNEEINWDHAESCSGEIAATLRNLNIAALGHSQRGPESMWPRAAALLAEAARAQVLADDAREEARCVFAAATRS